MLIRKATLADLPAINEIYNSAVARGYTADISPVSLEERQQWFIAHGENYPVFVIEEDSEVAGWLSLSAYRPGREALRSTAEVSYYVHENYRHRGLGKLLVRHAIAAMSQYGFKNLFAIILENNLHSIALIEKSGFKRWGFLPRVANFKGFTCGQYYYGINVL